MSMTTGLKARHDEAVARKAVASLALPVLKRLKAERAEYEEECKRAARQGFAPHYCPHGMNLWVDYDPICGPCEEGLTVYEQALAVARDLFATYLQRLEWFMAHPGGLPQPVLEGLVEWVVEPLQQPGRAS